MYNWFYKEVRRPCYSFGIETIEDFLFGFAWDEPHLKKNLPLLDELLQKSGDSKYRLTIWQEAYPRRSAMLDEMKKARKEKVI